MFQVPLSSLLGVLGMLCLIHGFVRFRLFEGLQTLGASITRVFRSHSETDSDSIFLEAEDGNEADEAESKKRREAIEQYAKLLAFVGSELIVEVRKLLVCQNIFRGFVALVVCATVASLGALPFNFFNIYFYAFFAAMLVPKLNSHFTPLENEIWCLMRRLIPHRSRRSHRQASARRHDVKLKRQ